jgi:hypothetical protein
MDDCGVHRDLVWVNEQGNGIGTLVSTAELTCENTFKGK